MRVQLLSAILLAVVIIDVSKTEQSYETLNGTPDGDVSRELEFGEAFYNRYLQDENNFDLGNSSSTTPDDNSNNGGTTGTDSTTPDDNSSNGGTNGTDSTTPDDNSSNGGTNGTDSTTPDDNSSNGGTNGTDSTTPDDNSSNGETNGTSPVTPDPGENDTTSQPPIGSEDYPIKVSKCIFAKMDITLQVTYEKKDNTNATVTITVPPEVKATGSCEETAAVMYLTWDKPSSATRNTRDLNDVYAVDPNANKVTFHFKKSGEKSSLDKIDIDIHLDDKNFADAKYPTLSTTSEANLNLFSSTGESKSVCNVETPVPMADDKVTMKITNVELIAFNEQDDLTSKSVENCVKSAEEIVEESNVGAIVGGVIAALVIVGIIGFIIWRRKRNTTTPSEVA